jgi:hypothetical protein
MKVMFWNVQRLGERSPADKQRIIANIIEHTFINYEIGLVVLCEVTSNSIIKAVVEELIDDGYSKPSIFKRTTSWKVQKIAYKSA